MLLKKGIFAISYKNLETELEYSTISYMKIANLNTIKLTGHLRKHALIAL